jgi:hypothetical protein
MKISLETTATTLLVNVKVANIWDEVVYLANYLFDWFGILGDPELNYQRNRSAPPTRSLAFLCLQGKTALLLQGDPPPPPLGISVFEPRLPLATRLAPGDTYAGTIKVPLPLLEWSAYQSPEMEHTRAVPVKSVKLRLEYTRHSTCDHAKEHSYFRGTWEISGNTESLEATASIDVPVVLLERTDAFKRFT